MTTNLIRYDAACHALAECKAVDEVKDWHDKAAAMQAYARMANEKGMEIDAAEIRLRAERRLGELILAQKAAGGLNKGTAGTGNANISKSLFTGPRQPRGPVNANVSHNEQPPTLADANISYDLSSRAQKLATVPEEQFEAEVGEWRERVSAEGERVTRRLVGAAQPKAKTDPRDATIAELRRDLASANERIQDLSDELRAVDAIQSDEQFDLIRALQAERSTLRSQLADYQNQCNALKRQIRYLQKAAAPGGASGC